MAPEAHINPPPDEIAALAHQQPSGELLGHNQAAWREKTRLELGLVTDRPIIATGHQTLLWHPGILIKYLLMESVAAAHDFGRANLVVDQHVDRFGEFEVPIRRSDGSLAVRRIELTPVRKDVPMGMQPPFTPNPLPAHLPYALECVREGVERTVAAIEAHRDAPNAAVQMAHALGDLMARWVKPAPNVTATDLGQTSLARALLQAMTDDPQACAEAYNRAVAAVPEAGIGPLLVRDDYVELPLWRLRDDGRRMRAYDNDVQSVLADASLPPLLPRALFMTALVRLGMCDVFIHGTGGANYDRAMELWMREWLGVEVAPVAVATATLHLPLVNKDADKLPSDVQTARHAARRVWHDPEALDGGGSPGPRKRDMLRGIENLPRRSLARKSSFFEMHEELERMREARQDEVAAAQQRVKQAARRAADGRIASRRDWPFPLYPINMLDQLSEQVNMSTTAHQVNRQRA